ncbi:MAG: hypothetical protein RIC06_00475 [Cyclobacteriaceae bacterium]
MIKKNYRRAVDGGIIEIPLWDNFGYSYAKRIDGTKHPELEGLIDIIRVFNFWTKEPLEDLTILTTTPTLISLLVAGLSRPITQKYWKVVGKSSIINDDLEPLILKKRIDDEDPWFLTENGRKRVELPVDNTWDDYEQYIYQGTGNIEIMLTLKFMELEGINPQDHMDVTDERVSWMLK